MEEKKCPVCGKTVTDKKRTYCSRECYVEARNERQREAYYEKIGKMPNWRKCAICGTIFTPKKVNQICCCEECSAERKRRREKDYNHRNRMRACTWCNQGYMSADPTRKYCSAACEEEGKKHLLRRDREPKYEKYDPKKVKKKHKELVKFNGEALAKGLSYGQLDAVKRGLLRV